MKEKERNDYGLINPDGRITGVFESKNASLNDGKFFTKENNVSEVNEQEQIKEQVSSKTDLRAKSTREPTTNLISVSGFFATTAVAFAGAAVVVAYVVAAAAVSAALAVAELFAITSDSMTFNVQCYLNGENSYIAKLYDEEQAIYEFEITEPFIEFYELNPNTEYILEIVNAESEETVFQKEFKTAPEDTYRVSFESWVEKSTLMIYAYSNEDIIIPEDVTSYTIYVFDKNGNSIYTNTVEELQEEYSIELPEELFMAIENPKESNLDQTVDEPNMQEEMLYVIVLYNWNDSPIGRIQYVPICG